MNCKIFFRFIFRKKVIQLQEKNFKNIFTVLHLFSNVLKTIYLHSNNVLMSINFFVEQNSNDYIIKQWKH
jgi:hypothetical protein